MNTNHTDIQQVCRSENDTRIESSFYLPALDAAGILVEVSPGNFVPPSQLPKGSKFMLQRGWDQVNVEVNSQGEYGRTYRRFRNTKRPHTKALGGPVTVHGVNKIAKGIV